MPVDRPGAGLEEGDRWAGDPMGRWTGESPGSLSENLDEPEDQGQERNANLSPATTTHVWVSSSPSIRYAHVASPVNQRHPIMRDRWTIDCMLAVDIAALEPI